MKVLVLGGTRFFGKQLVQGLLNKGYEVTIGTRGQTADPFGDQVQRITLDRMDKVSLETHLAGHAFDVVYDNICYAPDDLKHLLEVMEGDIGRYIVTSSLAVYDEGIDLKEEAFNPYTYPIQYGNRSDFSYAEGKRQIEAVVYQSFDVPTVAVRFPVVIGENDYTRRLAFYVEHVLKSIPFIAKDDEYPMSFITEEEAGQFLVLLAESDFVGPINAASHGMTNVKWIVEKIENLANKKALLQGEDADLAPYSAFGNVSLDSTKAIALGMNFVQVEDAFTQIIQFEMKQYNK